MATLDRPRDVVTRDLHLPARVAAAPTRAYSDHGDQPHAPVAYAGRGYMTGARAAVNQQGKPGGIMGIVTLIAATALVVVFSAGIRIVQPVTGV